MGAIANMAPDKYRVILSQVPFVDVVTTMLDPSIPLTTNEYDEWGNPEKKDYYDYMLSYSPYDNLKAQAYPAMFVGTGLWDSQVQYFEPAKYVARLRDLDTAGPDARCCSASTWMRGTAASRGASAAIASCRRCTRSCSRNWAPPVPMACKPPPRSDTLAPMTRVRLAAVALFAALPLAGCGNKGPLILNPEPQEMPEGMAAPSASVAPPSSATVMPAPRDDGRTALGIDGRAAFHFDDRTALRNDDRTAGRHRWDARYAALKPIR